MNVPVKLGAGRFPFGALRPACLVSATVMLAMTAAVSAQQLKDIKVGLSTSSLTAGSVRVAREMGLYQKYGLNPTFSAMDNGNAALTGLIGGSFQVVVATTGDLIAARTRGQNVVAIASVFDGLAATLVLSKSVANKLGVSPTAPVQERFKALEGLMIALSGPTANVSLAFKSAVQAAGVTTRTVYVANADMPAALESGAVQGFFTSSSFWGPAVAKGSAVVWLRGPQGEFPPESTPVTAATIQMTLDYARNNPDVVRGFIGANEDFSKALIERPAEVKAAAAKAFPQAAPAILDLFFDNESSAWKTKPFTAKEMAHEIEFAKASGLPATESLDPATMVYSIK